MARPELADKPNGLRAVLEAACSAEACPASALTVLSTPVDPYRLDTPTGRAEGAWLAEQMGHSASSTGRSICAGCTMPWCQPPAS